MFFRFSLQLLLVSSVAALRGDDNAVSTPTTTTTIEQRGLVTVPMKNENQVLCRVILIDTLEDENSFSSLISLAGPPRDLFSNYDVGCIPIQAHWEEEKLGRILKLDLGEEFLSKHLDVLPYAELIVAIQGASFSDVTHSVIMPENAIVTALSPPPSSKNKGQPVIPLSPPVRQRTLEFQQNNKNNNNNHLRRNSAASTELQTRQLEATDPPVKPSLERFFVMGPKRLLGIRIITGDSEPTTTYQEFHDALFSSPVSVMTQFYYCSHGQLRFAPAGDMGVGVIDVKVPENSDFYDSPEGIVQATMESMIADMGITSVQDITDFAIFCLPNNVRTVPGSAGVGWWRARMADEWCDSLSGMMHETGHLLGLLHSGQNITNRYDDVTGYMGMGVQNPTVPLKCYNGHHHWKLGWYATRSTYINVPQTEPGWATTVKIATFVDFLKTDEDEYVVVNVEDRYFLQYNRAKDFNIDTGEERDKITIVEDMGFASDLKIGLNMTSDRFWVGTNFSGAGHSIVIEVCEQIEGGDTWPDYMVVSIGLETSLCGDSEYMDSTSTSITSFSTMPPTLFLVDAPTPTPQALPPAALAAVETFVQAKSLNFGASNGVGNIYGKFVKKEKAPEDPNRSGKL